MKKVLEACWLRYHFKVHHKWKALYTNKPGINKWDYVAQFDSNLLRAYLYVFIFIFIVVLRKIKKTKTKRYLSK